MFGYEQRFGIVYFSYVCWDSTRYPVIIQILNYLEKNEVPIVTRIPFFSIKCIYLVLNRLGLVHRRISKKKCGIELQKSVKLLKKISKKYKMPDKVQQKLYFQPFGQIKRIFDITRLDLVGNWVLKIQPRYKKKPFLDEKFSFHARNEF